MINGLYQLLTRLGYTDPLHAPLTHFPIGLVFGALIFFLVAIIFKQSRLVLTARHASILAFVMVFPTILFGVIDWIHFFNGALIDPIKYKIGLATIVLIVLAIGIIVGSEVKLHTWTMTIVYVVAFLAVVGLGWFGAGLYPGTLRRNLAAAPAAQPATAEPAPSQPAAPPTPGAQAAKPAAKPASAASTQAGQKIFADSCEACHADGGNLVVSNLPLKSSKQLASLSTFAAFIRAPKMPDGAEGVMPPFPADQISDRQAADLYAYITAMVKTTWK
jgi:mono/diheme cytochrome c family protein